MTRRSALAGDHRSQCGPVRAGLLGPRYPHKCEYVLAPASRIAEKDVDRDKCRGLQLRSTDSVGLLSFEAPVIYNQEERRMRVFRSSSTPSGTLPPPNSTYTSTPTHDADLYPPCWLCRRINLCSKRDTFSLGRRVFLPSCRHWLRSRLLC